MNMIKPPFALTDDDKQSKLWQRLMAHMNDRLDKLRAKNDGALSELDTARLRGSIAQLKDLLALNNEAPDLESPPR